MRKNSVTVIIFLHVGRWALGDLECILRSRNTFSLQLASASAAGPTVPLTGAAEGDAV